MPETHGIRGEQGARSRHPCCITQGGKEKKIANIRLKEIGKASSDKLGSFIQEQEKQRREARTRVRELLLREIVEPNGGEAKNNFNEETTGHHQLAQERD